METVSCGMSSRWLARKDSRYVDISCGRLYTQVHLSDDFMINGYRNYANKMEDPI